MLVVSIGLGKVSGRLKTIVVANPKGGSGKTTLCTNLAAFFACHGEPVVILDYDQQRCCRDWLAARATTRAPISLVPAFREEVRIPPGTEWVVVDLPAACHDEALTRHLRIADLLLLPVLPSPIDFRALFHYLFELNKGVLVDRPDLRVGIVANRVRENTIMFRNLTELLEQFEIPLVAHLRDTQNYPLAAETGDSIFELPTRRAIRDLVQWQKLVDWITMERRLSALVPEKAAQLRTPSARHPALVVPA